MRYLFQTFAEIDGRQISYKIYLHTNGSHYAESMNATFDNFLLQKVNNQWTTRLSRNQGTAAQLGLAIEHFADDGQ